jgi:haloalkane dehalogenase
MNRVRTDTTALEGKFPMIAANETFDGTWPYPARFDEAAGFRQHYVDVGPERPDQTIVMLHGEPTWGYEWRHLIGPLSRHHRVIVPDHMGFGKSETPENRTYDASEHILNLQSLLVDTLDLTDITLVVRDWGGPIGTAFALHNPGRISRIFAVNTVLPLAEGIGDLMEANVAESRWFQWARSALADGSFEQILGQASHTIAQLMIVLQHVARPEIATPTWIRAYSSPFPTPAQCRGVIAFPRQVLEGPLGPQPGPPPMEAVAAVRGLPAMLAVGMRDTALLPNYVIQAFRLSYPDAPVVEIPGAGHFPTEDTPETLLALLELFLQTSART